VTMNWHVVYTDRRRECDVLSRLTAVPAVAAAFCPMERRDSFARGARRTEVRPVLSSTLFAQWDGEDGTSWRAVRDCSHVRDILGGWPPRPILDGSLDVWRTCADADGVVDWGQVKGDGGRAVVELWRLANGWTMGDRVVVTDRASAWYGHSGLCTMIDEQNFTAKIVFPLFTNRELGLMLPAKALCLADDAVGQNNADRQRDVRRGYVLRRKRRSVFAAAAW
jgi:hypothetical protein